MSNQEIEKLLAEAKEIERNKPIRKVFGVRISEDYGKSWRARALCEECYKTIEPPNMAKKEIEAGAYSCDWCGCRNEMYVRGKEDGQSKS